MLRVEVGVNRERRFDVCMPCLLLRGENVTPARYMLVIKVCRSQCGVIGGITIGTPAGSCLFPNSCPFSLRYILKSPYAMFKFHVAFPHRLNEDSVCIRRAPVTRGRVRGNLRGRFDKPVWDVDRMPQAVLVCGFTTGISRG